jgi:Fe-S cluster biogenesis protein NfuA
MKTMSATDLKSRVAAALEEVRPALRADGGDVELLGIEGDRVRVHLLGECGRCPMARSTLADFVAERIRLWAPEIQTIDAE